MFHSLLFREEHLAQTREIVVNDQAQPSKHGVIDADRVALAGQDHPATAGGRQPGVRQVKPDLMDSYEKHYFITLSVLEVAFRDLQQTIHPLLAN